MATRGGHVAKTRDQRRQYMETVVRGQDTTATVPTSWGNEEAATDAPLQREDEARTVRPTRRRRAPSWWEQHRAEVWKALGIAAVVGLLGWYGSTLIALNREVGQLQRGAEDLSRQLSELRSDGRHADDRLDDELRRLRERLEDVRERVLTRSRPAQK